MIEWIKLETEYEETMKEKVDSNCQLYYENFTGQYYRANKSELELAMQRLNELIKDSKNKGCDCISYNEYASIFGLRKSELGYAYGIDIRRIGP